MDIYTGTTVQKTLDVTKLYTIHYFEYYRGYSFKGERHDFWEFIYADRGALTVCAGDTQYTLNQGQLMFHPPGEFHTVETSGNEAANSIVVSFECNSPALESLADRVISVATSERLLLSGIISEARSAYENDLGDPGYTSLIRRSDCDAFAAEQYIVLMLETLLIRLIRRSTSGNSSAPEGRHTGEEYFSIAARYIDENLASPFSLTTLCAKVGISSAHLERLCRRSTGKSVIQYCRERRIARAKELLRNGHMSITAIASVTGFTSVHYFSRTFKAVVGMSPSQYLRSVKSMTDTPANYHP